MRRRAMMLLARALWPAVLLSATMLLLAPPAWPQGYPSRPIKLVVPFPAGGPSDFFSRILAHGLSAELGQQVVLENRAGAGGVTGVDSVVKSPPDGYTIGLTSGSVLSAIPFMMAKFPFDWQKDLTLLTLVARVREVLAVHPSVPVNTLQDLVARASRLMPLVKEGFAASLTEAATRFALSHPAKGIILVGMATPQQFEDALAAVQKGPLPGAALDRLTALRQTFAGEPR